MRLYLPIAKVDAAAHMVYGYASTEAQDDQGEVVKREALEGALGDYMRFGNIREMHQLSAVGKAKNAEIDDKGLYLGAKVVDDRAWEKVVEGVYSGFSIGGKVLEREAGDPKTISKLRLDEISLVDRPANPEAVFDCWKRSVEPIGIQMDPLAALKAAIARVEALVKAGEDPYGEVEYADPGYQEDKKKRYPIDGEKHIRAAWNYIHKPKNAGKYSADEVNRIKAKIVAAWKDKIDPKGPPEADDGEKAARAELKKHLWDVGGVAEIILRLDWLKDCLATEAIVEGDGDEQAKRLEAIVDELCGFLNALVAEETAEIIGDREDMGTAGEPAAAMMMSAIASSLAKSGLAGRAKAFEALAKARHSMGDQALLDCAHGACKAARGIDGLTKAEAGHLNDCMDALKAAGAHESHGEDSTQDTARNPEHKAPNVMPPAEEYRPGEYTTVNTAEHTKRLLALIAQSLGKRGRAHQALMDVAHGCLNKLTDGKTCAADGWGLLPSAEDKPSPTLEGGDGSKKVGGRHSKETMQHLRKAHGHLVAAGGKCDAVGTTDDHPLDDEAEEEGEGTEFEHPGKARRPGNLKKRYDALAESVADLAPRLDAIAKTVEQIKNTPLPPLTRSAAGLTRVEKSRDGVGGGDPTDAELMARIAKMSPDEQAMLLIKAARMKPYRIGVPGAANTGNG
jgi:phage head maturation protease